MYAGNVGACARVAANFELTDARIVSPLCDWRAGEARLYAKGPALKFLEGMQECATLAQALEGCTHAVGFTRRSGELRRASVSLGEVAGLARAGVGARGAEHGATARVALVFGREDGGLTKEELLACTEVCSYIVGEIMPSLNLSHAVAIAVARVYEDVQAAVPPDENAASIEEISAPLEQVSALFDHWREVAVEIGLTSAGNPERMLSHLRRLVQRGRPTEQDVAILRAYLSKTQVALGTRRRGKRV